MARARNIKPGFFKNEDLAECSIPARLCFAGLWCLADREGRLEDRAKRIKGELFPFDSIDVAPLLGELAHWKFIRRYSWGGKEYIQIANFAKHQVPHGTEKDGVHPDENGFITVHQRTSNGYITGAGESQRIDLTVNDTSPTQPANSEITVKEGSLEGGQNTLNPDSLNPDSLIPENTPLPPKGGERPKRKRKEVTAEVWNGFTAFYEAYPRKVGQKAALAAWLKLCPDEALMARIMAGLRAQLPHMDRREKGRFIKHPASWINGEHWNDEVAGVSPHAATAPSGEPLWWQIAGFDHPAEAQNAECHIGNYREFANGQRRQAELGVTA